MHAFSQFLWGVWFYTDLCLVSYAVKREVPIYSWIVKHSK